MIIVSVNLLGRSLTELLTILGKAADRDIAIIVLDERIDATTAPNMPLATMVGLLNAYQKFQRREAVLAGRAVARAAGVRRLHAHAR